MTDKPKQSKYERLLFWTKGEPLIAKIRSTHNRGRSIAIPPERRARLYDRAAAIYNARKGKGRTVKKLGEAMASRNYARLERIIANMGKHRPSGLFLPESKARGTGGAS